MARRSLDVQTYIWHADLTGMFFAYQVIEAADPYWNSPSAYPMELLDNSAVGAGALAKLRAVLGSHVREAENSRYARVLRKDQRGLARAATLDPPRI